MLISLKDNQYKAVPWSDAVKGGSSYVCIKPALDLIDRIPLNELNKESKKSRFLVFPSTAAQKDLDDKEFILALTDKESGNPGFKTGNVMGYFGLHNEDGEDVQVQITSRFDNEYKNYFLHYMLQKISNVAYVPETTSDKESIFDFLCYLFPNYLNAACTQGIFRSYVTRQYNDANVRGPIGVSNHIRYNEPFNGKIAYHTREYVSDNYMTQLIRHAIEYIRTMPFGNVILNGGEYGETRDNVNSIIAATPTYSRFSRNKVIARNLHPVVHPFYTQFEPLRRICIAILTHKRLNYGNENEPISGILFDGASLWEEYLAKVFDSCPELGVKHANNRLKENGVRIFENGGVYYPDFYRKGNAAGLQGFVIDAKYKRLNKTEFSEAFEVESEFKASIDRDDLFQMLAYLHTLPAQNAFLVFPQESKKINCTEVSVSEPKVALGYGGAVKAIGMPIPYYDSNCSFDSFSEKMKDIENKLVEKIREEIL